MSWLLEYLLRHLLVDLISGSRGKTVGTDLLVGLLLFRLPVTQRGNTSLLKVRREIEVKREIEGKRVHKVKRLIQFSRLKRVV